MDDLTVSRKQRLRTLENQIRSNYEAFVQTGFALKEIRDDELFTEDGFKTWDAYLKQRVGSVFGIEERQVRTLILCAQVRPKLPDTPNRQHAADSDSVAEGWSQRELLEFARLAPKKDGPGQPYDVDSLRKQDVQRVAKRVLAHCEEEGTKPTASVVRKFVDEDLGIDRAEKAKKTKQQREEAESVDLGQLLIDMTDRIEVEMEMLQTTVPIGDEGWKLLRRERPKVIGRLIAAATTLADFLRKVEE